MQPTTITHLGFQIVSPPQGDGVILEVFDDNDEVFMDVKIDKHDVRFVTLYESSKPISIPLSELARLLDVAQREVKNVAVDALFNTKRLSLNL
jgi:hypothetical protein